MSFGSDSLDPSFVEKHVLSDKKFNQLLNADKKEVPEVLQHYIKGRSNTHLNTLISATDAAKLTNPENLNRIGNTDHYETKTNIKFIELEQKFETGGKGGKEKRMLRKRIKVILHLFQCMLLFIVGTVVVVVVVVVVVAVCYK